MSNGIQLSALQRSLLIRLLKLAAEEFHNHGCNDFDLGNLSDADREEATQLMRLGSGDPEYPPVERYADDNWLMEGFVKLLEADP